MLFEIIDQVAPARLARITGGFQLAPLAPANPAIRVPGTVVSPLVISSAQGWSTDRAGVAVRGTR
ncbi:MAG: hypothetical protein WBP09_05465 [Propionicimonas sp.]